MKTYIRVPVTQGGGYPGRIVQFLRRALPSANPSCEDLYERVTMFHVEIDAETGQPLREIGFDADGRSLALAPWNENRGCVVDCGHALDATIHEQITAEQFEQEWQSFDASKVA